jgi:hypothetical protein
LNADDITWWESDFVGVAENNIGYVPESNLGPTIISGQLHLPAGNTYIVYDIAGRQVDPGKLKPGIYFIQSGKQIVRKIVRIK